MAQMPRGEPRSVPDPVGDLYNEMIRQEKSKKEQAEAATAKLLKVQAADYFSRPKDPFGFLPEARRQESARLANARYAPSVYLDPNVPLVSSAELAKRRGAIDRAFFMAKNPLAGAAYGIASLANASPQHRDAAMMAGGAADAVMQGVAPRGAPIRARPSPPRSTPVAPPLDLSPIRYRELNELGRAQGINATLVAPLSPTKKKVPEWLVPPGLQPRGMGYWNQKGHLGAGQLGGVSDDPRNIAAVTQSPTNTSWMKSFENMAARRVRSGEQIDYSVTPLYGPGALPPELFLMTASGPKEGPVARLVGNPVNDKREAAVVARLFAKRGRPRR